LKAFFDSISVSQQQNRAELNATIPPGFIKKLVSEAPPATIGAAPPPEKKPTPETRRHRGRRTK
jgi:hypothetical protein